LELKINLGNVHEVNIEGLENCAENNCFQDLLRISKWQINNGKLIDKRPSLPFKTANFYEITNLLSIPQSHSVPSKA
jgi:hypothetical protein